MSATEFDRLTASERAVLMLLAEGHTAKSIAAVTGFSVAAVNERLREARRKTGIGSSRELARLLAQKNNDQKIGMVSKQESGSGTLMPPGRQSSRGGKKEALIMGILAIGIGVALAMQGNPVSNKQGFEDDVSPKELLAQLRSEPRDTEWASKSEMQIRHYYEAVEDFSVIGVQCATSVCEIIGAVTTQEEGRATKASLRLQEEAFSSGLEKMGFQIAVMVFRENFFAFLQRKVPKPDEINKGETNKTAG